MTRPVVALLIVLAATGCELRQGRSLSGRASDEWVRTYTVQNGGEFQIVGATGTVEVQGGMGANIEVRAERVVRAPTVEMAQSMVSRVRIREDVASEKAVLQTQGLAGIVLGVEVEVNYHVMVPASTRVRVRTANGDIRLTNLSGSVAVSSDQGAIEATGLSGGTDVRSTNGAVTIAMAAVSEDPIDVRATNGSIELSLPASANATLEARCTNGTIDVDAVRWRAVGEQTPRRMRGRLNEGGTPIQLTSTNGNIRVRTSTVPASAEPEQR
jgi:hypothetical protein